MKASRGMGDINPAKQPKVNKSAVLLKTGGKPGKLGKRARLAETLKKLGK
jgi:hypothetical protein